MKIRDASNDKLVRYYEEITEADGPFRKAIPLTNLIPILVAGWKDAGIFLSLKVMC